MELKSVHIHFAPGRNRRSFPIEYSYIHTYTSNIKMKKGDVGLVKRFSKKYGNKGRAFN